MSTDYTLAMKLSLLEKELSGILDISSYPFDHCLNGVEVGDLERDIKKVAFSVDAGSLAIKGAIESGADMLFVHHGLFWSDPFRITGASYEKIKLMLDNNLALFACHLPLDAHLGLGNNFQIAMHLGMTDLDPFGLYKGKYIGYKGELPMEMRIDQITRLLSFTEENGLKVFPFGKEKIKTVAIVSGSGSDDILQASLSSVDCFITGEVLHQDFQMMLDSRLTVIAGGHYKSEVFGVKAVMRMLNSKYGLDTVFIDCPTGL